MRLLSLSISLVFLFSGCSSLYPTKERVISIQQQPQRVVGAVTLPTTIIQEEQFSQEPIVIVEDESKPPQRQPKIQTPAPPLPPQTQTELKKRAEVPHNKKLQKIMRKFDYLIFTQINSEVENGEEDMFFGKNTKKLLKEFIKDTKEATTLYPNADETYIKLSKRLEKEASKLYKIVKIKKMDWVKPQVENVINVCNGCHAIYRL